MTSSLPSTTSETTLPTDPQSGNKTFSTVTKKVGAFLYFMQWLNYLTKGGGSLFPIETATWMEICIRVYQLPPTLRVHTHNTSFFKVPYHKSVKQKNDLVPWGTYATNSWSLPAVVNWHWIYQTVRIPCLTVEDPNRKVSDLYYFKKVVDPKLQVANLILKADVWNWDPAGSPNLTPGRILKRTRPVRFW